MAPNTILIPNSIKAKISQVYNQYQCAFLMRCWLRFGAFSFVFIVLFTLVLLFWEIHSFSRWWPIIIFLLIEIAAFVLLVFQPMRQPITRDQIALYIEENYPELENRIISAVSFESENIEGSPAWILDRFYQDVDIQMKRIAFSKILDADRLTKLLVISTCFLLLCGLTLALFHHLWLPGFSWIHSQKTLRPPVYEFKVEPGDVFIRVGDNQTVFCTASSLPGAAVLSWRIGGQSWQKAGMDQSPSDGVYYFTLTNIQNDIQYYVQMDAYQSETYTIHAWTPPKLKSLDATYIYPEYLQKPPEAKSNIDRIMGVEGARIELTARVNKPLEKAEWIFNSSETIFMQKSSDLSWTASMQLHQNDLFSIVLTDEDGKSSEYNPKYEIIVQEDRPPQITLTFPRKDLEATALDEIPIEFEMTDDFGLKDYGIQYEVAGQEAVFISLRDSDRMQKESSITESFLWQMEELNLEAGDLITWALKAQDYKPDRNEFEELSDPFFIEIRPFRRTYENAISNAGANQRQNSENQSNPEDLSQKEIIIATWNLRRDAPALNEDEFMKKRTLIIDAQQALAAHYAESQNPPPEQLPVYQDLLDAMEEAVKRLEAASQQNPAPPLTGALVQEQKAYRLILKLKPQRSQVQQQMAGSRNAGGSQNRPEIQELDLDRKRNYYEEERRSQQQLEQSDEALNDIKDIARRQKSINEEMSQMITEMQKEQAMEERKRRLERLEEQERQNIKRLDELESQLAMSGNRDERVDEAMRRLDDIRRQMSRSIEQIQQDQLQEARISGTRAIDALGGMEEAFRQDTRENAAERMKDLQEKMNALISQEKSILEKIEDIQTEQKKPSLKFDDNLDQEKQALQESKQQLAEEFLDSIAMANDIVERTKHSQALFSRKLGDWMRETSAQGIYEDIRNEERTPLIRYGIWDDAVKREERILEKLRQSAQHLEEAAQSLIGSDLEGMQLALDQLRRLIDSDVDPSSENSPPALSSRSIANATDDAQIQVSPNERSRDDSLQSSNSGSLSSGDSSRRETAAPPESENAEIQSPEQSGGRSGMTGGGIRSPESMRRFIESDYPDWADSLQNAEQLLPRENSNREQLARIREAAESMRSDFKRNRQPPRYDIFLETVSKPLIQTAFNLEREIQAILSQEEYLLNIEGKVPEQYRRQVAEYFKNLSVTRTDLK
ncbi:MAG: hypothetical protein JXR73_04310 [Candidatus Omnitrophica bacterium]|nr:hypothetical protein [Candidatus Omnitrophota bacterium]